MQKDIFTKDELSIRKIEKGWSKTDLLKTKGLFYLRDIESLLQINSVTVKRWAKYTRSIGKDPYQTMGVKKIWGIWYVRMWVFSRFYQDNFIRVIDDSWDAETLLSQGGLFKLVHVCQILGINERSIHQLIKKSRNPKKEYGVWQNPSSKYYVAYMPTFSRWHKNL
ncbi:MAG: hypothetical protein QNK37_08505 [Acidobacteriota bacterium]|nr:hypothetical protein [Acidobacteriota bacterium]